MNSEQIVPVRHRGGRPPALPWNGLRDQIAEHIARGYGVKQLARHYGVTPGGMRRVLRRLKLQTLWQAEWQAEHEAARH
jgi:AraC-like DNA-binding protein